MATRAERLRRARESVGMTQAALSRASGIGQPNIAAYENGARPLSDAMFHRLLIAVDARPSIIVSTHREDIIETARRHGAHNVRVFGSVARGDDDVDSDVDLLVSFAPGTSLYDVAELTNELEDLLGASVDVVSDRGVSEGHRELIADAQAL